MKFDWVDQTLLKSPARNKTEINPCILGSLSGTSIMYQAFEPHPENPYGSGE